jgi:ATP-binding cassette subfamily G (WHITE) protein 2 (SNQ2)
MQAAGFNVFYKYIWRDYGIFWAYCVFNFAVVFLASYLYLGGGKKIKSALSPTARKNKQLQRTKSNIV